MLNIDEFTKRLEQLFEVYELTPSTFADKIGVQRSSISHLLSGRNKPSLDFVLKVQDVFPEVEMNWLLHGKGNMNQSPSPTPSKSLNLFDQNNTIEQEVITIENNKEITIEPEITSTEKKLEVTPLEKTVENKSDTLTNDLTDSTIDKIVIFYKNGTFKSFKPD